jgi:hypothetical protein
MVNFGHFQSIAIHESVRAVSGSIGLFGGLSRVWMLQQHSQQGHPALRQPGIKLLLRSRRRREQPHTRGHRKHPRRFRQGDAEPIPPRGTAHCFQAIRLASGAAGPSIQQPVRLIEQEKDLKCF